MTSKLGYDDFIHVCTILYNVIRLLHDYTVTQKQSNGLKFDIHIKEWEG